MNARLLAALALAIALPACGGGGGSAALPTTTHPNIAPVTAPTLAPATSARIALFIPSAPTASALARSPRYIATGTNGIGLVVKDVNANIQLATQSYDVSNSSALCAPVTGGRSCTLAVATPATASGDMTAFTFSSYDSAPVSGSIPSSAKLLSTGVVNTFITANQPNTITVSLTGVATHIDFLSYTPASIMPGPPICIMPTMCFPGPTMNTPASTGTTPITNVSTYSGSAFSAQYVLQLKDAQGNLLPVSTLAGSFAPSFSIAAETNFASAAPGYTMVAANGLANPLSINYTGGGFYNATPYYAAVTAKLTYPAGTPLSAGENLIVAQDFNINPIFASTALVSGSPTITNPAAARMSSVAFFAGGQSVTISVSQHGGTFTDSGNCNSTALLGSPKFSTPATTNATLTITSAAATAQSTGTACSVAVTNQDTLPVSFALGYTVSTSAVSVPNSFVYAMSPLSQGFSIYDPASNTFVLTVSDPTHITDTGGYGIAHGPVGADGSVDVYASTGNTLVKYHVTVASGVYSAAYVETDTPTSATHGNSSYNLGGFAFDPTDNSMWIASRSYNMIENYGAPVNAASFGSSLMTRITLSGFSPADVQINPHGDLYVSGTDGSGAAIGGIFLKSGSAHPCCAPTYTFTDAIGDMAGSLSFDAARNVYLLSESGSTGGFFNYGSSAPYAAAPVGQQLLNGRNMVVTPGGQIFVSTGSGTIQTYNSTTGSPVRVSPTNTLNGTVEPFSVIAL